MLRNILVVCLLLVTAALTGCGTKEKDPPPPGASTPTPTTPAGGDKKEKTAPIF